MITLQKLKGRRSWRLFSYGVILVLSLPNLVFSLGDQRLWSWDIADYGEVTVKLTQALLYYPTYWLHAMLSTMVSPPGAPVVSEANVPPAIYWTGIPIYWSGQPLLEGLTGAKPPAHVWLGQFFTPLWPIFGSIDVALILSVIVTQGISLIILYESLIRLIRGQQTVALIACLVVMASPLCIGLSHAYFPEPLQGLVVNWFIFIMVASVGWRQERLAWHLIAAGSLAIAVKSTSLVYCLGPGLIALYRLWRPVPGTGQVDTAKFWMIGRWLGLLVWVVLVGAWYARNLTGVWHYAYHVSTQAVWGPDDSFLAKLNFWLTIFKLNFFPIVGLIPLLLLLVLVGVKLSRRRSPLFHRQEVLFGLYTLVAAGQIGLLIVAFSFSPNVDNRYLFPLVNYFALILAWALVQIQQRWVNFITILLFTIQLVLCHGIAWGGVQMNIQMTPWLFPRANHPFATFIFASPAFRAPTETILEQTCHLPKTAERSYYQTVIGTDTLRQFEFLNPHTLNYQVSKEIFQHPEQAPCFYTSLGFQQEDPDQAWQAIERVNPDFVITPDPQHPYFADLTNPLNSVIQAVAHRIQTDARFAVQHVMPLDGGYQIYIYARKYARK